MQFDSPLGAYHFSNHFFHSTNGNEMIYKSVIASMVTLNYKTEPDEGELLKIKL